MILLSFRPPPFFALYPPLFFHALAQYALKACDPCDGCAPCANFSSVQYVEKKKNKMKKGKWSAIGCSG